ncbi:hypothetical protein XELAEV_18028825mg [Xenopus laevis]|uniref:Uncharacterized protein n=1 Tax=Xenopus laevis TaxID=8355 RepID=A0A974CS99_XENLA|nr:hypothetical protein XELAEV_18028825mg [Xenopus laevis]
MGLTASCTSVTAHRNQSYLGFGFLTCNRQQMRCKWVVVCSTSKDVMYVYQTCGATFISQTISCAYPLS